MLFLFRVLIISVNSWKNVYDNTYHYFLYLYTVRLSSYLYSPPCTSVWQDTNNNNIGGDSTMFLSCCKAWHGYSLPETFQYLLYITVCRTHTCQIVLYVYLLYCLLSLLQSRQSTQNIETYRPIMYANTENIRGGGRTDPLNPWAI